MRISKILHFFNTGTEHENPWWLAGGVAESDTYTIYSPVSATSLADSKINLANPGVRDAIAGVDPSHSQNVGWTFNGTTQWLNSQTLMGQTSTMVIWFEDCTGVYAIGSQDVGPTRYVALRPVENPNTAFYKGTGSATAGGTSRGGIIGMNQTNGFKQGISVATLGAWSGATGNDFVYIGGLNANGTANQFAAVKIRRVAMYPGVSLTDAQFLAVAKAGNDYNQPSADPYESVVLSTNPVCYWPCTQAYGSAIFDKSGNEAHGESYFLSVGNSQGNKGLSIAGDGVTSHNLYTVGNWAARTGLNLNEYSIGAWIKVTVDASNQVRVFNTYSNNQTEYSALEIRTGNQLTLFHRENGVDQNIGSSLLPDVVDGQWHHVILYNSLSAGKYGIYFDGVKYEFTKTLTGFADTSPDYGYPYVWQDAFGYVQHVPMWDHALSQSEVNTLYI